MKHTKVLIQCDQCGKLFNPYYGQLKDRWQHRFCSMQCKAIFYTGKKLRKTPQTVINDICKEVLQDEYGIDLDLASDTKKK